MLTASLVGLGVVLRVAEEERCWGEEDSTTLRIGAGDAAGSWDADSSAGDSLANTRGWAAARAAGRPGGRAPDPAAKAVLENCA
jgi:hypothetical protein